MTAVFLQGNALSVLKGLPPDFFHCAVTSPPYFGLRKYDGGVEVWDGDGNCQHEWGSSVETGDNRFRAGHNAVVGACLNPRVWEGGKLGSDRCTRCGAVRCQLGAEPTPELYISHLVQICTEVKRVLRPDGVFWLNIGDSWAGSNCGSNGYRAKTGLGSRPSDRYIGQKPGLPEGTKPLDMILVPSQLALALRADGWYIRSIVIWSKTNPMPESVNGWRWERHKIKVSDSGRDEEAWRVGANGTPQQDHAPDGSFQSSAVWQDCPGCPKCSPNGGYVLRKGSWRPTDSYEQIFMLTKTGDYYCDREAVLEPSITSDSRRPYTSEGAWGVDGRPRKQRHGGEARSGDCSGRNLRSVWEFPTRPFKGAHFATFAPRLPELCIKSSASERGCCPGCGAPWARVIDRHSIGHGGDTDCSYPAGTAASRLALLRQAAREQGGEYASDSRTLGWRPICSCPPADPVPCRVLDPFSGAGTTALACERLSVDSVSIDTSTEYIQMSRGRLAIDEQRRSEKVGKRGGT